MMAGIILCCTGCSHDLRFVVGDPPPVPPQVTPLAQLDRFESGFDQRSARLPYRVNVPDVSYTCPLVVAPDDRHVVIAGVEALWFVDRKGAGARRIAVPGLAVNAVAIDARSGVAAVTGSADPRTKVGPRIWKSDPWPPGSWSVRLVDLRTGAELRRWDLDRAVWSVAFGRLGPHIRVFRGDSSLRLVECGSPATSPADGNACDLGAIVLLERGGTWRPHRALVREDDGWMGLTGLEDSDFVGRRMQVGYLETFSVDGTRCLFGGSGNYAGPLVRFRGAAFGVWDTASRKLVRRVFQDRRIVVPGQIAALSYGGRWAAWATYNDLWVFDVDEGRLVGHVEGHLDGPLRDSRIFGMAFLHGDPTLVVLKTDGELSEWRFPLIGGPPGRKSIGERKGGEEKKL